MHHIRSIIKEGNSLHRKHRIPPSGFRPGRANAAIAIQMLSRSDTCAVSLEYRNRTGLRPSDARAAKPLARRTAPQLRTSLKSHRVRPCSALRAQLDMHDRDRALHDDAEQPHIEWLHCIDDTTEFGSERLVKNSRSNISKLHDSIMSCIKSKTQSSQTDLAALQTQRDDDRIATLDANHPRMEAECKVHSAERKFWWPEWPSQLK